MINDDIFDIINKKEKGETEWNININSWLNKLDVTNNFMHNNWLYKIDVKIILIFTDHSTIQILHIYLRPKKLSIYNETAH